MSVAEQFGESRSSPMLPHAIDYARRGWAVFPCNPRNKAPLIRCDKDAFGHDVPNSGGLYKATRDEASIETWWSRWPDAMIGVRMGAASGVWAIDPDAPKQPGDPDGRAAWSALLTKHGAVHTHAHLTPGGGNHILFKWDANRLVTNREGGLKGTGINVRGEGGYIIAPPSRRHDGKVYSIVEPLDFFCFAEAPEWLYKLILPTHESGPSASEHVPRDRKPNNHRAYAEAALRNEAAAVAAERHERNNRLYKAAMSLGTLVGAGVLSEGEVIGALYDASVANGYVASDGPRATIATINSGLQAGMQQPRDFSKDDEPTYRERSDEAGDRQWANGKQSSSERQSGQPLIKATPYVWKDGKHIPRRRWLYGGHLIRKFGSATFAPPGVGKTILEMTEAAAMASGRSLLGIVPAERARVWYWNGEDPREELERRLAAVCLHYHLTKDSLEGWLFLDSGREQEIIIARETRDGAIIAEPVVEAVASAITENHIDVLIIDPFISSHRVTENDNNAIDVVAKRWTAIADKTNCAVELVHHTKKTYGAEVTVEDGRGAVALLAAVRSARVLNRMSPVDGEKFGVQHRQFFSAENGKANLAPPPQARDWFQIESVHLENGEQGNILDRGDSVGVVKRWQVPDATAGITGNDFDKVATVIRAGRWRENPQAAGWVGNAAAKALGLDVQNKADKTKITAILKMWIAKGALRIVEGEDQKRNLRKFVEVADHVDD